VLPAGKESTAWWRHLVAGALADFCLRWPNAQLGSLPCSPAHIPLPAVGSQGYYWGPRRTVVLQWRLRPDTLVKPGLPLSTVLAQLESGGWYESVELKLGKPCKPCKRCKRCKPCKRCSASVRQCCSGRCG